MWFTGTFHNTQHDRAVYEIMLKSIVERNRPQTTIWRMRIACWIPKVTNTHSEYRATDKSLARPTSRCILFDGENISFDTSLVIYIYSTNISPIHHELPPWIRSLDLFRHRRVAVVSWGVHDLFFL